MAIANVDTDDPLTFVFQDFSVAGEHYLYLMKAKNFILCLLVLIAGLFAGKPNNSFNETTKQQPALIHTVSYQHHRHHQGALPFDYHWQSLAAITVVPAAAIALIFCMASAPKTLSKKNKMNHFPCYCLVLVCLIYFHVATELDSTLAHISNPIQFDEYSSVHKAITRSPPYFLFELECYHRTGSKNKKVVTHTAKEAYHPKKWRDESPSAPDLFVSSNYVFVEYNLHHYFGTKRARQNYRRAKQNFLAEHTRDKNHTLTVTFHNPEH